VGGESRLTESAAVDARAARSKPADVASPTLWLRFCEDARCGHGDEEEAGGDWESARVPLQLQRELISFKHIPPVTFTGQAFLLHSHIEPAFK
jgi:hypothetical protein